MVGLSELFCWKKLHAVSNGSSLWAAVLWIIAHEFITKSDLFNIIHTFLIHRYYKNVDLNSIIFIYLMWHVSGIWNVPVKCVFVIINSL